LHQLTNNNSDQDSGPIFAPDGSVIVFTREKPDGAREFWSIAPRGTELKKLEAAPNWYAQAKSSPYFTNVEPEESTSATPSPSTAATPVPTYKSPDGCVELVLREDPNDEDDQIDRPGHGKHYLLRNLQTGVETEFSKLPGFEGRLRFAARQPGQRSTFPLRRAVAPRTFRFALEQHGR
jgi:Tol biopolymer transport system component